MTTNDDQYVPTDEDVRSVQAELEAAVVDYRSPNIDLASRALSALTAAEHRATRAEAERDGWRQTALDERGAALDTLEQIKVRDARIKAVRDVLDQAEASISHHPAYTFNGQRMDPIVNGADIRRALEG